MHTHHITPSREYVNSVRVRHLPVHMRRITHPDVQLLLFESFGGFGKGVGEILWGAANVLQNKLTRAQYLDEVTWTTKSWLGLQKQRISVVLHTAIAEQIVNELACGEGGRVHGAKCLAVLAGVAYIGEDTSECMSSSLLPASTAQSVHTPRLLRFP
mgnify:CR=1 FL=1